MKKQWTQELADLPALLRLGAAACPDDVCSAYEPDVSACLDYLHGQRIRDLGDVKVTHLRGFLAEEQTRRPAVSSQARTTAAVDFGHDVVRSTRHASRMQWGRPQ